MKFKIPEYKKPNLNANLKIRKMTDPEKALASDAEEYVHKSGKVKWSGAAKILWGLAKKPFQR